MRLLLNPCSKAGNSLDLAGALFIVKKQLSWIMYIIMNIININVLTQSHIIYVQKKVYILFSHQSLIQAKFFFTQQINCKVCCNQLKLAISKGAYQTILCFVLSQAFTLFYPLQLCYYQMVILNTSPSK